MSRTCSVCEGPIYRRPNCRTCSASCRRIAILIRALLREPCVVCGRGVDTGKRPGCRTCSPECASTRPLFGRHPRPGADQSPLDAGGNPQSKELPA